MLTLPIKSSWYHMILAGIKREEYRDDTRYYGARFERYKGQRITIKLRNGYSSTSPTAICEVTPIRRARGHNPEWGGDPSKHYWVLIIHSAHEIRG